jgi:hypothetical protein
MVDHRLKLLAVAAALSLGASTQAAAGCCGDPSPEIYVVNQGPIFAGPGQGLPREGAYVPPCCGYPYVGYVYSGYPYGLDNSGGYPRGSYSPFTGYPYIEGARPYVNYRMSYRPARVHPRKIAPRAMPSAR